MQWHWYERKYEMTEGAKIWVLLLFSFLSPFIKTHRLLAFWFHSNFRWTAPLILPVSRRRMRRISIGRCVPAVCSYRDANQGTMIIRTDRWSISVWRMVLLSMKFIFQLNPLSVRLSSLYADFVLELFKRWVFVWILVISICI